MKKLIIYCLFVIALPLLAHSGENSRARNLFDSGWKFYRGDAKGAEAVGFNDRQWRAVEIPHDWSIERVPGTESLFDKKYPQDAGCLPGGTGWYRKTFTPSAADAGKRIFIEFEGVYMDSEVWLNGAKLGRRPYGYSSFQYELTDQLNWGGPNVISVRCNAEQPCSRWFSGAGIYRHVWMHVANPVHVAQWGAYITTPKVDKNAAAVQIRTDVMNQGKAGAEVILRTSILDPQGNKVAEVKTPLKIGGNAQAVAEQRLTVGTPALWSLEHPQLYTAVSEVLEGDRVVDHYRTPFGIRTIEFTLENGFLLNGERVQIKGVCNHHDQGPIGAVANDRAIERQLEILKQMGCNAIRTSHNPPAPKLLELCDRMGFLVMDEAFDEWKKSKRKMGYGRFFDEWSEEDLVAMLRRDRNHPSIILWSIGNEIYEQADANGGQMARRLADICRREDPSRPVSAACNNPGFAAKTGYADALDVFGINYNVSAYNTFHGKYKLLGSETASDVSSRGEYNLVDKEGKIAIEPKLNNQVTSYDIYHPGWSLLIAERQLKALADAPWVAGEFVWTGFDYYGEPTPIPWPAVSSYFGIVDLCGFPKDRYYLYQSRWTDAPMVHILPHWNWEQFAGKTIPVWCYSNADSVELFLNGKSLGEKKMATGSVQKLFLEQRKLPDGTMKAAEVETGYYHVAWEVPWEAGTLKAVARRVGKVIANDEVSTAGKPAKIALEVDRSKIKDDGQDLAYVTVKVLDAQGHVCPDASNMVKFDLSGPGKIAGVGNGDPTCHEDFLASQRSAFHGLCLAVVQSLRNQPGELRLKASAEGLAGAEITIQVTPHQ